MDKNALLRSLPKVDELLRVIMETPDEGVPYAVLLESARETVEQIRQDILSGKIKNVPAIASVAEAARLSAKTEAGCRLRFLINATGVVLHTNFGRAVMAESVARHVARAAASYTNLEYDIETGGRGSRHSHAEGLITYLAGSEAAMAVNNNVAALLLALAALCAGKEAVVSRGELVEIGGSFRIPDVMRQSGAILREVGTTNKTRADDYAAAVTDNTGAILKVHTSNFIIKGFTEDAGVEELVRLGRERGVPVIHDLGSGAMIDTRRFGAGREPSVRESVSAGAGVVCFSGDKLLGGPQAGIIAGKQKYIDLMKKHPLARALRIDKLSLAALEATLRLYLEPDKIFETVPVLKMLSAGTDALEKKAEKLLEQIAPYAARSFDAKIISSHGEAGGGSLPGYEPESRAVEVRPYGITVNCLEEKLRKYETPVVGRIHKGGFLMDVRTVDEKDFMIIGRAFASVFG